MSIGIDYRTFMHLVPIELGAFFKSYNQKRQIKDEEMWMWFGNYGISALIFAIDRCFSKTPQYEYVSEPILTNYHTSKELTEEEKQKEVDRFYKNNERMRKKWKRTHKNKSNG